MEKDKDFKSAYEDARESLIDFTESQAMNMIKGIPELDKEGKFIGWKKAPSEAMIIFTLKTLGKARGYVEKVETDVTTKGESINNPFYEFLKQTGISNHQQK